MMTDNMTIFNHLSNNATIHPTYCDYAQQVLILLTVLPDVTNKHDNTKSTLVILMAITTRPSHGS